MNNFNYILCVFLSFDVSFYLSFQKESNNMNVCK